MRIQGTVILATIGAALLATPAGAQEYKIGISAGLTGYAATVDRAWRDGVEIAAAEYPHACWIIALHHHVVEYPWAAKALSERIGTALINGNWFIRSLRPLTGRAILMHGHRHIDWIGHIADLPIVSAPSPVMEVTDEKATHFYIHSLAIDGNGKLGLLDPERIVLPGEPTV